MNILELKNVVTGLLFEENLEDEERFFQSVNRAIYRVRMNFPKIATYKIPQYPIANILGENHSRIYDSKEKSVIVANDVMAYSFEGYGKGRVIFKWYNANPTVQGFETVTICEFESYGRFRNFKGFVKRNGEFCLGEFRVELDSPYNFKVKNLAMYDTIMSYEQNEIPEFSEWINYDLKYLTREISACRGVDKIREVFQGLNKEPKLEKDGEYHPLEYTITDGVFSVNRKVVGDINLVYIKDPETVGVATKANCRIDVPLHLTDALGYLVASNLILDEDSEKSNHYLTLYREAEANALNATKMGYQVYVNTSNWC